MLETLQHLDQHILLSLNSLHTPYWDNFMWLFTGKIIWIPMYASILYVLLRNFNLSVTLFTLVAIALTITYADQICASLIRPLVERMRPSNPNNPLSEFIHLVNDKRGGRYGFPSCHSSNSFALAFFVFLFFRQRWLTFFIVLWAIANSYTRIYIGVHYPGDLLAGMVVGISGAVMIYSLYRYALRRPVIARFLHYDAPHRQLIEHSENIKYTTTILYIGLLTLAFIAIYAIF